MDWSMPGFPVHHQFLELAHIKSVESGCHPTISSSVIPFSSFPQSFLESESFPLESVLCIRWPKYWSFSFSISPSNECSGLISFRIDWFDFLAVQGLSRVFSNTIVQKHQFFSSQPSLWSNSHIHAWLLDKPCFDYTNRCWQSFVSALLIHCLGLS